METRTALGLGVLCMAIGCGSSSKPTPLEVGVEDDGGGALAEVEGGTSGPLAAHIEAHHVTVKIVTLGCSGECADVVAVASGGQPPYAFAWEDGSTPAERHVCPTATTRYHVTVTDDRAGQGDDLRGARGGGGTWARPANDDHVERSSPPCTAGDRARG